MDFSSIEVKSYTCGGWDVKIDGEYLSVWNPISIGAAIWERASQDETGATAKVPPWFPNGPDKPADMVALRIFIGALYLSRRDDKEAGIRYLQDKAGFNMEQAAKSLTMSKVVNTEPPPKTRTVEVRGKSFCGGWNVFVDGKQVTGDAREKAKRVMEVTGAEIRPNMTWEDADLYLAGAFVIEHILSGKMGPDEATEKMRQFGYDETAIARLKLEIAEALAVILMAAAITGAL